MKQYMENRILSIAHYTVDHNSTVRSTARKFGISKSTVHKDLTERLPQIDHHLAEEVRDILDVNKSERHIRGGMATRRNICSCSAEWMRSCARRGYACARMVVSSPSHTPFTV